MKLALIGVGQAGGKVVDEFLAYDARTGADIVRGAIAGELPHPTARLTTRA